MCDKQCAGKIPAEVKAELRQAILNLDVMPSMRCMMTAGKALDIDNVAAFNCAYVAIDKQSAFDEMLYILMCGTGVGFSVERQFINDLPTIAKHLRPSRTVIKVEDSRVGWADAYRELVSMLYQGRIPEWDVSEVRPAGAKLKTFGGRASGPQPLVDLFKFTIATFKEAAGEKLNSIQCHDICCKIGEIVVSGGVRRSAEISLSNLSDKRMQHAKDGNFFQTTPWRAMANNSVAYTEKPGNGEFMREWLSLYESQSGERGIFNRQAAKKQAEKYGRRKLSGMVEREIDGKKEMVKVHYEFGCNPCSEIILRSKQFCNLSEVVVRPKDTLDDLMRKVRLATILGTMQATLTNFRYLSEEWKKNTEEEALLGVSLTGIMDNHLTSANLGKGLDRVEELKKALESLRVHAVEVNKEWASNLGINQAAAITCVKPSGTVSQLVDCSSGIHARYAKYFIRRVRCDKKDPLAKLMLDQGFPMEIDAYKPDHQVVFSFPMAVPKGSITADNLMALDQLDMWLIYQNYWCEHKPSMTVYIQESEWMRVGAWVYDNFDAVSGIAFLPYEKHGYAQAPYEPVSKQEYEALLAKMPPDVDWSLLKNYEVDDTSINHKEYACTGGACELVDVVSSQGEDNCKQADSKD
jgi:ribonucleoside-diphosphate reductase alpha chain